MIQHCWSYAPPMYIVADCFGKQFWDVLVRFFCQYFEVFPDLRFNLWTDFNSGHVIIMVGMSWFVNVAVVFLFCQQRYRLCWSTTGALVRPVNQWLSMIFCFFRHSGMFLAGIYFLLQFTDLSKLNIRLSPWRHVMFLQWSVVWYIQFTFN